MSSQGAAGVATISRSAVLLRRGAPTHTPTASVHQFGAMKILSLPKCVHKRPLLFDRHHSFRSCVLDQQQFVRHSVQFVTPLLWRSLPADCTRVSSARALHAPMLPAPSSEDLR